MIVGYAKGAEHGVIAHSLASDKTTFTNVHFRWGLPLMGEAFIKGK